MALAPHFGFHLTSSFREMRIGYLAMRCISKLMKGSLVLSFAQSGPVGQRRLCRPCHGENADRRVAAAPVDSHPSRGKRRLALYFSNGSALDLRTQRSMHSLQLWRRYCPVSQVNYDRTSLASSPHLHPPRLARRRGGLCLQSVVRSRARRYPGPGASVKRSWPS